MDPRVARCRGQPPLTWDELTHDLPDSLDYLELRANNVWPGVYKKDGTFLELDPDEEPMAILGGWDDEGTGLLLFFLDFPLQEVFHLILVLFSNADLERSLEEVNALEVEVEGFGERPQNILMQRTCRFDSCPVLYLNCCKDLIVLVLHIAGFAQVLMLQYLRLVHFEFELAGTSDAEPVPLRLLMAGADVTLYVVLRSFLIAADWACPVLLSQRRKVVHVPVLA